MFRPSPISLLQIGVYWTVMGVAAVALIVAYARRERETGGKRSARSRLGIALEAIGFVATGFGPVRVTLPWSAPSSIVSSMLVILLGGSAVAIFVAATRAMGKNWSVVARTRSDHELVRSGPFRFVRHPIYLALLLFLVSIAIAFGHYVQLLVALPVYLTGTTIRVHEEETLLRAQFGDDHARYMREVPAFIPFIR